MGLIDSTKSWIELPDIKEDKKHKWME